MIRGYSFTRGVRHCLIAAREEAERLGHEEVEPVHILLGVLAVPDALPSHIAQALDIDAASLRTEAERRAGRGPEAPGARPDVSYTNAAKRVLELAMDEAARLESDDVDAVHVLLGLLADVDGTAGNLLREHGVELDTARHVVATVQPPVPPPSRSMVHRFFTWLRGDSEPTTTNR